MAVVVELQNPKTGELKKVKVGWSWTLFLFAGFLGLPLFLRRLPIWGAIMLAVWGMYVIIPLIVSDQYSAGLFKAGMGLLMIALGIFLAIKGNEMTGKNYLENGWQWADPSQPSVAQAMAKWGLVGRLSGPSVQASEVT